MINKLLCLKMKHNNLRTIKLLSVNYVNLLFIFNFVPFLAYFYKNGMGPEWNLGSGFRLPNN